MKISDETRTRLIEALVDAAQNVAEVARDCGLTYEQLTVWANDVYTERQVAGVCLVAELQARVVLARMRVHAVSKLSRLALDDEVDDETARKASQTLLGLNLSQHKPIVPNRPTALDRQMKRWLDPDPDDDGDDTPPPPRRPRKPPNPKSPPGDAQSPARESAPKSSARESTPQSPARATAAQSPPLRSCGAGPGPSAPTPTAPSPSAPRCAATQDANVTVAQRGGAKSQVGEGGLVQGSAQVRDRQISQPPRAASSCSCVASAPARPQPRAPGLTAMASRAGPIAFSGLHRARSPTYDYSGMAA